MLFYTFVPQSLPPFITATCSATAQNVGSEVYVEILYSSGDGGRSGAVPGKGCQGSDVESSVLLPQAYRIIIPSGPSHKAVFGC